MGKENDTDGVGGDNGEKVSVRRERQLAYFLRDVDLELLYDCEPVYLGHE